MVCRLRNHPYFNPRSHKGSDTRDGLPLFSAIYFNPRSHKGSDYTDRKSAKEHDISIHAPTRGATAKLKMLEEAAVISIHAPTRGATKTQSHWFDAAKISIHAPTRGATERRERTKKSQNTFQSTLPQGERHRPTKGRRQGCNFNPRSHKGSD